MDICNALYSPKPQMQYESDNSVKKNTTKKIKQQNRPNAERTCAETTVDEPISNHANDSRGSMAFTRVCVSVCLSVCPWDKTKPAETTMTGIVHHESSPTS